MSSNPSKVLVLAALTVQMLQGCDRARAPTELAAGEALAASTEKTGRYLVLFSAERIPAGFKDGVAQLGGSVEASLESIGVAAVTGLSESAAAELATTAEIRNVESDPVTSSAVDYEETPDALTESPALAALATADAAASPTAAQFYA